MKPIEPKVKTGLVRSKSGGSLAGHIKSSGSKRHILFQGSNNFHSNEDRFNTVMRINDLGINYRYNNSRLKEEIDINMEKQVRRDIKNNVDSRYTDLEHLLNQNLGGEAIKDHILKPPQAPRS
jgi:hypothetical protein